MSDNFLEAQSKNRRRAIALVMLFVLLCALSGAGVDSTLMEGIGTMWFSLYGLILLAFLGPLWLARFLVKVVWAFRDPGEVDEFGYEQESVWVPLFLIMVPFAGVLILMLIWMVTHGVSFDFLGVLRVDHGHVATSFPIATLTGVLVGGGGAWWATVNGERTILALSKTRLPDPQEIREKQLLDVVAEIAIAAGIPEPDVLILKDRDANAFAIASAGSCGTIVATWGLVQELTREELQTVVAHEVAHLRNRDARLMTLLAMLYGSVNVIGSWARRSGGLTIGRASALLLAPVWVTVGLLSPLMSRLIGLSVSRQREFLADASAVELTRTPGALISALTKIEADELPTWNVVRAVAHQCIVDPLGSAVNKSESWWSNLFATHPPMKRRLMVLRAMAYSTCREHTGMVGAAT